MGSARVLVTPSGDAEEDGALSAQETDLLDRSTKKPKVVPDGNDTKTVVMETQLSQQGGANNIVVEEAKTVKFKTASGEYFDRKMVSYKDVCLGVNGHHLSEEDAELFEAEAMDQGGAHQDQAEQSEFMGDPLYPVVNFFPMEDDLRRVAVWVRIPSLPFEFYDRRVLWRIGNVLGKTVKIDSNTLRENSGCQGEFATERAKFARVCIKVDLKRIFISKFSLEGRVYPVKYEGLHLVCFQCGRYGHKKEGCPLNLQHKEVPEFEKADRDDTGEVNQEQRNTVVDKAEDTSFSPWMIAKRPQRRNSLKSSEIHGANTENNVQVLKKNQGGNNKEITSGSRFDILQADCEEVNDTNQDHIVQAVIASDLGRESTRNTSEKRGNKGISNIPILRSKGGSRNVTRGELGRGVKGTVGSARALGKDKESSHVGLAATTNMESCPNDFSVGTKATEDVQRVGLDWVVRSKGKCNKPIEPSKQGGVKLGLSLKNQIKFKNVKQVARHAGERSGLSFPLMCDVLLGPDALVFNKDPTMSGLDGGGDVFNTRPPDSNAVENTGLMATQCMESACEHMNMEVLNEDNTLMVQAPSQEN
ncbi:Zinc finger, CCHC-type [Sesbania bispinosa]|nr:Zinc finger, CCHC-type [Sesbania bispinosa]